MQDHQVRSPVADGSVVTVDTREVVRPWLAHHGPEHAQRCIHVGRQVVCRRCAFLYPVAAVSGLLVLALDPPTALLLAAMWVLPVPMVLDWACEHLGRLAYSPTRQVIVTIIGAPALGVALAIHAVAPLSLSAVVPMVFFATICALVAGLAWYRDAPEEDAGWEERHQEEERARDARLERLLSETDPIGSAGPR